ncbi:MAG: MBL fold metallo-hydrolase [Clostridia bacterium]|nr:MBL fold metallo-hydrolase [Clostridia bacterium]
MHSIKVTDVRAVAGDSAFLIDDGKTSIMYDSGFAFTGYKVADNIKKILGSRKLDYIFLTHSHYDHALGSAYVKRRYPNAKVVAGEYAAKIFAKQSAKAVMRDLDKKFAAKCGIAEYEDLTDELSVDITVNDGDIVKAGEMEFTAVAFPGHTRCSMGYYLDENKLLLSSETLGVYGGPDIVLPSYLIGYEITMNSIAKAEGMDIESILLPHFGLLNREETKAYIKSSRRSAELTAKEIADLLRSGAADEEAAEFFKNKFFHGLIKEIYPADALELNTSIMVKLIRKELIEK